MKVHYTGRTNPLTLAQERRLEARFAKLARILDMKLGEREARVILKPERHLRHAEITVRFHDHNLVGVGAGGDDFLAMQEALERLEKQVQRLKTKWRDIKRTPREEWAETELALEQESLESEEPSGAEGRLLRRPESYDGRKP